MKWTNVVNTPPTGSVQVQTRPSGTLFQDETGVAFTATSATLTNQGIAWPSMKTAAGAGNFNLVPLRTRDENDTQLFLDWRY